MEYGNTDRQEPMIPDPSGDAVPGTCLEGISTTQGRDHQGKFVSVVMPTQSLHVIPINQESIPMSDFNPDDANTVSRFFQNIADKVVLASTLAKEVAELREVVQKLKADTEVYREHNARLDEEVNKLRLERVDLRDQVRVLSDEKAAIEVNSIAMSERHDAAQRNANHWSERSIRADEAVAIASRERDDAQMKVLELEEKIGALEYDLSSSRQTVQDAFAQLSAVRAALH